MRSGFFVCVLVIIAGCQSKESSDFLQKLDLRTLNNQPAELPGNKDSFRIVNFWATWCKPCIREIPSLVELKNILPEENLEIIFISNEEATHVGQFIQQKHLGIDSYIMPNSIETYGLVYLPTTYLIAPDGTVLMKEEGERDWTESFMTDQIKKAISEN